MIDYLSRMSFLILILFATACTKITVDQPVDGSVSLTKPDTFGVTFVSGIPSSLQLVLNSTDVTDLFTITDAGAVADGSLLADKVFSGKNQFTVVMGTRIVSSVFHFDDIGPTVHILSADHATGNISGYVTDPSGVASLTIDGNPVTVTGQNEFDATFTSMALNDVAAVDTNGFVSQVAYLRGDQELGNSISLRLNNGAFAFFADQAEVALNEYDFAGLLAEKEDGGINPVASDPVVRFESFYFEDTAIEISVLNDDTLAIHIELNNFLAAITTRPLLFTHTGEVTADKIVIETNILVGIENSDLTIGISNTTVDLANLEIEIDGLFGNLLGSLITNLVPVFVTIAEVALIPLASDFIADVYVENDIPINDKFLLAKIEPTSLVTSSLGMTIDIESSLSALPADENAVRHLGSVFKAGDLPSMGALTPDGSSFDVGASISVNLINQGLYAAHDAGALNLVLSAGDTGGVDAEAVSVIQSAGDDIQPSDLMTISLSPVSPPYIALMDDDDIHGLLRWHDVSIKLELQRIGWTEAKTVFTATFDLDVGFDLGATDEGMLHIGIERLPIIEILDFDMPGFIPLSPGFINRLVDRVMPLVLPYL